MEEVAQLASQTDVHAQRLKSTPNYHQDQQFVKDLQELTKQGKYSRVLNQVNKVMAHAEVEISDLDASVVRIQIHAALKMLEHLLGATYLKAEKSFKMIELLIESLRVFQDKITDMEVTIEELERAEKQQQAEYKML